jgi:hypothetical protein
VLPPSVSEDEVIATQGTMPQRTTACKQKKYHNILHQYM